jgi:hypothetical protein
MANLIAAYRQAEFDAGFEADWLDIWNDKSRLARITPGKQPLD